MRVLTPASPPCAPHGGRPVHSDRRLGPPAATPLLTPGPHHLPLCTRAPRHAHVSTREHTQAHADALMGTHALTHSRAHTLTHALGPGAAFSLWHLPGGSGASLVLGEGTASVPLDPASFGLRIPLQEPVRERLQTTLAGSGAGASLLLRGSGVLAKHCTLDPGPLGLQEHLAHTVCCAVQPPPHQGEVGLAKPVWGRAVILKIEGS